MEGATLNAYIDKLKPKQQEFIVACVREYTDRKSFHRGLLPFIAAREVYDCLRRRLDHAGFTLVSSVPVPDDEGVVTRTRFIKETISVFADAIPFETEFDKHEKVRMILSTRDLLREFNHVYKLRSLGPPQILTFDSVHLGIRARCIVQLTMIKHPYWEVDCSAKYMDAVTTALAERFRKHLNAPTRHK